MGSYFQLQAYFLTSEQQSFLTLTTDGEVFVITQNGPATASASYNYDSAASVSLMKEKLFFSNAQSPFSSIESIGTSENNAQGASAGNTTLYDELKKLVKTDLFAQSDTVWLIDAQQMPQCTLDSVEKNIAAFKTNCIPANQSLTLSLILDANKRQQTLKEFPLKSDTWLWIKHQFVAKYLSY